jgi:hypothetical protein
MPGVSSGPGPGKGAGAGPVVPGLLTIKVKWKLRSHCLLEDGKEFNLHHVPDSSKSMQIIQKTTSCGIVDGKITYETNDKEILGHQGKEVGFL